MMKETIDLFGKILTNILTVLYEPFGFSLLLSFLAMFFYLYAYEPTAAGKGWKSAIVTWYQKFKESVFFRKMFLLVFVTSMILFRTLLNRNLWLNPLSNVMGGWGIWETVNGEQKLTTECIENVIMMVPFTSMVIWTFQEKVGSSWKKILWYSGKVAFIFSISIQYRANGQWVLYSEHHGKGYTSSLTFRLQRSDGSEVEKLHTAWTQKGRKFLYHTLKRRGVLPLAEQGG